MTLQVLTVGKEFFAKHCSSVVHTSQIAQEQVERGDSLIIGSEAH